MNSKKKGNAGENKWSNWLMANGIKAYRNSSSGASIQKSDVHNSENINFEVKTAKHVNLKQAWRQTKRDAEMAHSIPYLIIHLDGMPDEEWLVVLSNHDWIDLVRPQNSGKNEKIAAKMRFSDENDEIPTRELKWAINGLKASAAKVMKML